MRRFRGVPSHTRNRLLFLPLIVAALFLSGCSTASLLTSDSQTTVAKYNGIVTPISSPVKAEYRPTALTIMTEVYAEGSVKYAGQRIGENVKASTQGNLWVSESGDKLRWAAIIDKMVVNGRTFKSNSALMEGRLVADRFGEVEDLEIVYSDLLQKADKDIATPGSASYEANVQNMKRLVPRLPVEPISTGTLLFSVPLAAFFQDTAEMSIRVPPEDKLEYVARGWSYYNNRKVMVAETSLSASLTASGSDEGNKINCLFHVNGYLLLDALTFAVLAGDTTAYTDFYHFGKKIGSSKMRERRTSQMLNEGK